jgi:hypothetical protein
LVCRTAFKTIKPPESNLKISDRCICTIFFMPWTGNRLVPLQIWCQRCRPAFDLSKLVDELSNLAVPVISSNTIIFGHLYGKLDKIHRGSKFRKRFRYAHRNQARPKELLTKLHLAGHLLNQSLAIKYMWKS